MTFKEPYEKYFPKKPTRILMLLMKKCNSGVFFNEIVELIEPRDDRTSQILKELKEKKLILSEKVKDSISKRVHKKYSLTKDGLILANKIRFEGFSEQEIQKFKDIGSTNKRIINLIYEIIEEVEELEYIISKKDMKDMLIKILKKNL